MRISTIVDYRIFTNSTGILRVAHAIGASYSKSVIIPHSINLSPHVQAGDQDANVPVPGVIDVILGVKAVAVLTEGL